MAGCLPVTCLGMLTGCACCALGGEKHLWDAALVTLGQRYAGLFTEDGAFSENVSV